MKKLGIVKHINHFGSMEIECENGQVELFFKGLKGYNKSLKVGDKCKVFFKNSILAGFTSYRVTKIK